MSYDDLRVAEVRTFLAAVRDGEQRGPGLDEMVATARVLDAIERSNATGPGSGRSDERAGHRQRAPQLRSVRDDGGHRVHGARPAGGARRDRRRGVRRNGPRPPGYYGEAGVLRERLAATDLELVGGFVPMRFSAPEHAEEDFGGLSHTLDLFDAAGATGARPVLCDAGGP
jgi:hypothetical protein